VWGALALSSFVAVAGGLAWFLDSGTHSIAGGSGQPIDFVVSCYKVNDTAALVPSIGMLFANEICNLLISLEPAYPGSCKEISRILSQKATIGKIKKIKEYLKTKSKKRVALQGRPW
jgi:hypothetical protein